MKASAGDVVMLVENCFPADSRVRNEAFTLRDSGFNVSVIALRKEGEPARETVEGVSVYRVPRLTVFKKLPGAAPSAGRRALNAVQSVFGYVTEYSYFTAACLALSLWIAARRGADVVHAHNPPDTLFVVGGLFRLLGKKYVFDHHDLSPELYLSRYRKTSGGVVPRVLRVLEGFSVRLANIVIATNESYREADVRNHGIDKGKVVIVRNGPDLRRVRPVAPDARLRSMGKTILFHVGAMNPQDGVDYLLRALHHLLVDLKQRDFFCVLVGDGDSRRELEALSAELGLSEHVEFTGFIPDHELMQRLSAADICLDPNPSSPLNDVSTWIKVMEYMALSKPIVSFDLKETRTSAAAAALYVPPNDEAAYARAIASLMADPAARKRMGDIGRRRVEDELSWAMTSKNLVAAYDRLFERDVPQFAPSRKEAAVDRIAHPGS